MSRLLVVLFVLSMAANAWMAYVLVDQAVWLSDMQRGRTWDRENVADIRRLLDRFGQFPTRNEVEHDMKNLFEDLDRTVVKWDGDTLWVNEIGLAFRGDSVERVVHMNEVN